MTCAEEKKQWFFQKMYRSFCGELKKNKKEIIFLVFLFSFSFFVRCIGLNFGYPLLVHPDEDTILESAFTMTQNRTMNSHNFNRPDQILILMNWFYLNLTSFIKFGGSLASTFLENQFFYYYRARILIALISSLIPIVVYKIGKESVIDYSVPAALLFAFFPVYVLHSHYVTPDVPITLFTLIIIFFSIRYIRTTNVKYLYLATIFAAINTAEKYPGLISCSLVAFVILWMQIVRHKDQPWLIVKNTFLEGIKFFCLFIFLLYIITPNIFIDYGDTIVTLKNEARTTHPGADGLGWSGNLFFYLTNFFDYSNVVVILFFIIGIIGLVKTRNFKILPGFYGLVYWIILSKMALHWERWGLPMYTFPLLITAFGVGYLWHILKERKAARTIVSIVFSLTLVWSFMFSLSISINLSYTDTTVAALQYSEDHGINKNNSVYDGYTPFSSRDPSMFNPEQIQASTEYILLSSRIFDRFYNEPELYTETIKRYENVMSKYSLVETFSPTLPVSSSKFVSWVDDTIYFTQKRLGKVLPERFNGYTILIYEIK